MMLAADLEQLPRGAKRRRLNHACDRCRSRKVRCDDRQPNCSNCVKAGATCTTKDLRNPTAVVVRHEAQLAHSAPQPIQAGANSIVNESTTTPSSITAHSSHISPHSLRENQDNDVSPPGQGVAAARLPSLPRFINGNSLYILTQWLDLAFSRLNHNFRFAHIYQESKIRHSTAPIISDPSFSILNDAQQRGAILDHFLRTVHRVFPFYSDTFWIRLMEENQPQGSVHAILQLLILAMHEDASSRDCLSFAFSQLSILIQAASLESVVALILMIIAFRGHDDSETASHILSVTNSIATALGLHRASSDASNDHVCAWWALYIMDKALAVELERPATLRIQDCNQREPEENSSFGVMVSLARIQENVVERMFQQRGLEESPDKSLEEIILYKMRLGGELDQILFTWRATLPRHLEISEHLFCSSAQLPQLAFVAVQFYQTLFTVHRNGLITNTKHLRNLVDTVFANEKYRYRLWNSSLVIYGTAKAIIMILCQVHDSNCDSILSTTYTPLIAAIVLAICVYKNPYSVTTGVDLELFAAAIAFIKQRSSPPRPADHTQKLVELLGLLHTDLVNRVSSIHVNSNGTANSQNRPLNGEMQSLPTLIEHVPPRSDDSVQNAVRSRDLEQQHEDDVLLNLNETDWNFLASDVTQWPDFLQILDLPEDLVLC